MAQHDQVIDNGPGLTVRTDINAAFAAIFSSSSGTVEPAVRVAGQLWFNTTTGRLSVRNAGNTAWVGVTGEMGGNVVIDTVNNYLKFTGTTPNVATALLQVRDNRTTTTTVGNAVLSVKRQNSDTDCLVFGNDGNGAALIGGNNVPMRFGNWVSGVFTESVNVSAAGVWTFTTSSQDVVIGGASTGIEIIGASANIKLTDNTAGAYDFWMHADGNRFYILCDRTATGTWDTPHPLDLNAQTNTGALFGQTIYTSGNLPPYPVVPPYDTAAAGSTLAMRDGSGDIHARLFRSEYDITSASIGFIMTQIDTVSNNFIRPSTPAQLAGALSGLVEPPVYALTSASNTVFPVGTTLMCLDFGSAVKNNSTVVVRLHSSETDNAYGIAGSGAVMSGTWRARGRSGGGGIVQRIN